MKVGIEETDTPLPHPLPNVFTGHQERVYTHPRVHGQHAALLCLSPHILLKH